MDNKEVFSSERKSRFIRHLSPIAVWALSFGCSVGWGAFVMPGTTFLPIAGPLGTAVGIIIGAVIMMIIGVNYFFLMKRYPDAGGTFSYAKNVFGHDHGFLASWFMILVYLAIIWANVTALPLIFRNLFGSVLQFGKLYTIAGYDVYVGEVLLSLASLLIFGFICTARGKTTSVVQIVFAVLLILGIVAGFGIVLFGPPNSSPVEVVKEINAEEFDLVGALFIVFLAPWAFAGFESVSHSTEELKFSIKKVFRIMLVALITASLAYILLSLMAAVNNQPENIGLPTFNAVFNSIGLPGIIILGVAAAAGIITGLVGNLVAGSRLVYSLADERMIPEKLGELNKNGIPRNAVLLLMLISLPIPFLGRSAIGWVIDINTIGVTVAYIYTSASAFVESIRTKNTLTKITGLAGIIISSFFLFYFLFPIDWSVSQLSRESYLMLLLWVLIGFIVYHFAFSKDKKLGGMRLGKSTIVWIVLLALIFSTSIIWLNKSNDIASDALIEKIQEVDELNYEEHGIVMTEEELARKSEIIKHELDEMTFNTVRNFAFLFIILIVSLLIIFNIYKSIQRSHMTAVEDKTVAEKSSDAKTTFLSNMSHDIRTPMNAIVGYVSLAKQEKDLPPKVENYLAKIESSSEHLLSLINDVLEMSRIESGKMELAPVSTDLRKIMKELKNLFSTQMETKGLNFIVSCEDVADPFVLCDANRLNRVLLNLVSNAFKFTPKDGTVSVILRQTGRENDRASFCIRVKDTGIGMSPEFVEKVFEAYERERTSTVENIQGTGLGTAITKSIVDLMGGEITVKSELGKGSEFTVNLTFPVDQSVTGDKMTEHAAAADSAFEGMKLLLVEDNEENKEVAKTLFESAGFIIETAVNGEEAVEMIAGSKPGTYSAVIMDIEMPVKNGYEATALIRSLRNPELSAIPIVALTAKAFSEDIAEAYKSGMNAFIAKPINTETIHNVMTQVLFGKK